MLPILYSRYVQYMELIRREYADSKTPHSADGPASGTFFVFLFFETARVIR